MNVKPLHYACTKNFNIFTITVTLTPGLTLTPGVLHSSPCSSNRRAKNEINDVTKYNIKSKQNISIYCAKITFNTIKYLWEGHVQSYFTIRNHCPVDVNKRRDSVGRRFTIYSPKVISLIRNSDITYSNYWYHLMNDWYH